MRQVDFLNRVQPAIGESASKRSWQRRLRATGARGNGGPGRMRHDDERSIHVAHHFSPAGRVRTMFTLAPAVLAVAVTGALSTPVAGASSKQSAKAVLAAARARLIKESQLAGQWTASSYGAGSSGGGSAGSDSSINVSQCKNVTEPGVDQDPYYVEGDYFDQKGTSAEIQEEIDVYPNSKQATKDVEFTAGSIFQSCYLTLFSQRKSSIAAGIGKGATVGTITLAPVPIAKYGQQSAEFRLVIPITYEGATFVLDYDYVVIAVGKYEAELDESDLSTPLPATIAANFEQAVVHGLKVG